ncbi:hypothetical protein ACFSTI_11520 [Rhizorhabdus histidinilytica]
MNGQTGLAADEAAYLTGAAEPATSSVLISNSKSSTARCSATSMRRWG